MATEIKAIVFKTPQLKATKLFFENILGLQIKESSLTHFVIYSKNLRLVFLKSERVFKIELYTAEITDKSKNNPYEEFNESSFETSVDPNGIKIIKVIEHQKPNKSYNGNKIIE